MIYNSKQTFGVFTLCFALIYCSGFVACNIQPSTPSKHHVRVIKSVTDTRGLTSVIVVCGKDTLAADYLTKAELDSLINP